MTALAVFDLDGTITDGDTFIAYLLHVLRHRPHRVLRCAALPLLAAGFRLGLVGNDEVKRRLLDAVAGGASRSDIRRFTETFIDICVRRMVKPAALERITMHAQRGDILVMATASLDIYADALGQRLGFHHVLATRAAWRDDRLIFGLDGPNLRGVDKVAAIEVIRAGLKVDPALVIVYSDHHSDLPLLRYADRGIAVDPTSRLAEAIVSLDISTERWKS
jgi:HAD superfamily hydrolase (TIGR01490 family)